MMRDDERMAAAIRMGTIVAEVFLDDRTWTCRYCGCDRTWIGSEMCDQCGREDCNQGQGDPVPAAHDANA